MFFPCRPFQSLIVYAWNDGMIGEYIFGTLRIMFSISSLFVENAFLLCIATWEISTSHMTRLNTKKAALLTHNIICTVTNKEDMVFWAGKALRRSPMHKQPFRDTHQHLGQLLGGIHNPRLLSLHTHKIVSQIGFHCLSLLELNLAKYSCSFLYQPTIIQRCNPHRVPICSFVVQTTETVGFIDLHLK